MKIISYGHSFLRKLFAIDLRALALFRISVATVLITDLCIRFQDLTAHHSGQGVSPGTVPLSAFFQWPLRLHSLSGNEFFQGFLFFLALIFAIQLLLGYRTWRAVLLCWVFHLSLLSRNGMIMTGGDSFLRLMLFWSLFVPLGAKWSVDHALNEEASSENKSHLSIGSAGILVQVFCLYFFAALTKTGASWTEHFTAVNMATQIEYLTLPFGHLLYYFPMLTRPLSFFVYGLEFWGAWLLFFPWKTQRVRIFLVAAFTLLQVGFALSMRLGIFPLIASVGGILFLPGSFFEFLRSVCGGESLKDRSLVYQKDQTRNKRIVLIIREMLLLRSFSILSSEDYLETKQSLVEENRGWALACPGGQTATGFLALKGLVMASPLFSWWPSFFQLIVAAILWAMMPLMALGARIFKESRQRRCKWIRNLLMQIVALMAFFLFVIKTIKAQHRQRISRRNLLLLSGISSKRVSINLGRPSCCISVGRCSHQILQPAMVGWSR